MSKNSSRLRSEAKKFMEDRDYREAMDGLAYEPPAGFEAQMLIDHFAEFAEEQVVAAVQLIESHFASVIFRDGFRMVRGVNRWIGSDGCEYDGPTDYLFQRFAAKGEN